MNKPAQVRVRLYEDDATVVQGLSGPALSSSAIVTMIVAAGIEAIRAAGGSVKLPLKFQVAGDEEEGRAPLPKKKAA